MNLPPELNCNPILIYDPTDETPGAPQGVIIYLACYPMSSDILLKTFQGSTVKQGANCVIAI